MDWHKPVMKMLPKPTQTNYSKLGKASLTDDKTAEYVETNPRRLMLTLVVFLSLVLLSVNLSIRHLRPTDNACSRQLSVWSPAFPALEIVDLQFDNSFFRSSPYRGKPTAELEQSWNSLWDHGFLAFDDDKLMLLNKSQDRPWRRTGDGRVLASLEVFHDLHCLNFIRQYTYREQYDYSDNEAFTGGEELVRHHVDHCIESIRLKLQCFSDLTPYLEEIKPAPSSKGFKVDFDTQHRCRNFDNIREWYRQNTVSWDELPT